MPYKKSNIIFKSGDTIVDALSKEDQNILRYKLNNGDKTKKVSLSEVDIIEMNDNYKKKLIKYFKVTGEDRYVGVSKVMHGKSIEIYSKDYSYTNNLAGGMSMSGTATNYYVKKKGDNEVTFIGDYDAVLGQFKIRVYDYFSDCPLLIKKLDEKEIRLRDGFKNIARFYINNCD